MHLPAYLPIRLPACEPECPTDLTCLPAPVSWQEAIDTCPVSCIHFVSEPQLELLEEALRRIMRIPAFLLVGVGVGGGAWI